MVVLTFGSIVFKKKLLLCLVFQKKYKLDTLKPSITYILKNELTCYRKNLRTHVLKVCRKAIWIVLFL